MADIKLNQDLDPTFARTTTANKKDGTSVASGAIRYENVVDTVVIDKEYEWDRGTYSRCDASGNILSIENMRPTFARASSGWIDGVAVAGSTPRFHGNVLEYGATNGFEYSTPTQTSPDAPANSNISFTSDFGGELGFTNCVTFVDNSLLRYVYPKCTGFVIQGKKYTLSCYIKMNDNSAPVPGSTVDSSRDFSIVIGNNPITAGYTITSVGNNVYRVSVTTSSASSTSNSNGVVKYTSQSSKGFKVTGFQIEENPSVTSYIATAGSVVNRTTTYNKIGYLSEKGVTNLVQRSAEFDNAYWTTDQSSVTANAVYAPDGTLSGDKLVENSATGTIHQIYRNAVLTVGQPGSVSIYARAGERNWLTILMDNTNAYFNLTTGALGTVGSGLTATITYVGNGWYRCTVTKAALTTTGQLSFKLANADAGQVYDGNGTSGLYIWGAQAEAKLAPTTYIPTTSATVTRNSEMLSIPAKDVIGPSGTIIINFYNDGDDTLNRNRVFLSATNGSVTTSGAMLIYQILGASGRWRSYFGKTDGTLQAISGGNSAITAGFHTMALRWTSTNQQIWVDGAFVASGALTETPSFGSNHLIYFGPNTTNSSGFGEVPISEVNFFNTTLSDADMALYGAASGYAIPVRAETTYQIKFNNNLYFATSGVYTSEWFNNGVSGAIMASSGVVTTPSGTSSLTEYRTDDSDSQVSPSSWSTTLGTGKYTQVRHTLVTDGTTASVPYVTSTSLYPSGSYGKCVTIEKGVTNMLITPGTPATQDVTVSAGGNYNLSIYGVDASSGTCVIEHKKVETTTADFDAGTLSNVDGTGNALAMAAAKAAPVFTRATSATNYDGSTVTSGNLRYHLGKNLLSKNQSDAETNTTGANSGAAGTTLSRDTVEFYQGVASFKAVCDGINTEQGIALYIKNSGAAYYPGLIPAASTLTASSYVKGSGNLKINIQIYYTDNTSSISSSTTFTATSTWTRREVTVSATAGKTIESVRLNVYTNGAQAVTFYIDNSQVEVGSSATEWVQGGSHAVMIEEATTNLLNSGFQDFGITPGRWQGFGSSDSSSGTITSGQIDPYGGSNAYRVQTVAGDNILKWFGAYGTGTNGFAYSGSLWIKNNDVSNAVTVFSNQGAQSSVVNNSDGWKLVKFENMVSNGSGIFQFQLRTAASGTNLDVTCMNPQYEQKSFCTTYIAPGSTRNADLMLVSSAGVFSNASVGTLLVRFKLDSLNSVALQSIADLGGTGATGAIFYRHQSGGNLRFQYGGDTGSQVNVAGSAILAANTWYNAGVKWGPTGVKIYLNGLLDGSGVTPANVAMLANMGIGGSPSDPNRCIQGQIDTLALYREELTDAELASMTASSGSIQLDRRTAYDLRFAGATTHGEGGYRLTTGVALDNIRTIGGSVIDWTATTPSGTSGVIETSIDNGTTWSTATDGSAITGLTDGVSATGKTFICRQSLLTSDTTSSPTLDDIEYRITQKWENIPSTFIKPVYTTLRFTPTNLSKFQLENATDKSSYYSGTRTADLLTIPVASGIISTASGSIVCRAFWGDKQLGCDGTQRAVSYLFSHSNAAFTSNVFALTRQVGSLNFFLKNSGGTTTNVSYAVTTGISRGWHTFGVTWNTSAAHLWVDGVKVASATGAINIPTSWSETFYIGQLHSGSTGSSWDSDIASFDIFSEVLTDAEMIAYTAATGAVIPTTIKHTYQMKFEDNLEYGMAGIFQSRWHDSGANTAGTPYVTYSKVETKPDGSDIKYYFKASDSQDDNAVYSEDITSITGRYFKTKIIIMSDDVNNIEPFVTSVKIFPQYS